MISAVGEHDETLARELGATPVATARAWPAGSARSARSTPYSTRPARASWPTRSPWPADLKRVITLSDPAAADFGVTPSQPTPDRAPDALDETIALLADGRLRLRAHQSMPMQQAARAHRQLESGTVHEREDT